MSHIIGRKCVSFCDTGCVKVCPVDCINGPIKIDGLGMEVEELKKSGEFYNLDKPQMYIDADTCIDCGACIAECPVDAIYSNEREAIREGDEEYVHKNYEFYGLKFN
jgi:NAD-dependent dihydropyrimidine dehydrogenase PreA subunit